MMEETTFKVYGYRWIALLFYSMLQGVMQMLWITFAPITGQAADFYHVTPLQIGLLSMIFMIVYLFLSIPASWMIDTYGIRKGVGLGAILTGVFGFTRGLFGDSYTIVFASTFMIAVAQPFILNSVTVMAARWFPLKERATAAGIAVLFQYLGIIVAMAATPFLAIKYTIPGMLNIFGVISIISAIVFFVFVKERPLTPPCPAEQDERTSVLEGLKHIFKQRNMIIAILLFFIGLGMFNAVSTWIEQILSPRGFNATQAGMVGAIMMIGGIAGASILPPLSDKYRRRKPFLLFAMICATPGLIGLSFVTSYPLLLVSGFVLGFFFMSAGPIGYQYSAEVSYPAPEATSQGLLVLSGQISGIIFIFGMDTFRAVSGSMTPSLVVLAGLMIVNIILCTMLKESSLIKAEYK